VLIGRSRKCDLRLSNVSVSREHALVRWDAGDYIVENAGSHNGVYVNGERVESSRLVSGDLVRLGKYTLVYLHGDLPRSLRDLEVENIPRWHSVTIGTSNDETFQYSPAQMARMVTARKLLEGARLVADGSADKLWVLGEEEWVLGKRAQIPLEGFWISSRSAIIKWNGRNHVLQHVGGWAKLRVNGMQVDRCILENGDVIDMGKNQYRYVVLA